MQTPQLAAAPLVEQAYGASVRATVALLRQLNHELEQLEAELVRSFEQHPDAEILCSLPGLGAVLGARVLGEFGDDPTRYHDARSRRCYAGTAPITRASGTKSVVIARTVRNRRLAHACYLWAYSSLRPSAELGVTTIGSGPRASHTIKRCGRSATGWSESCTDASSAASATTKQSRGRHPSKQPLDITVVGYLAWPVQMAPGREYLRRSDR